MKKSAICFALATLAGAVSAQQSVTLIGVADVSIRNISNGNISSYSAGSGGFAASRFGVRGQEDLGGGLAAGGWFEGTVNVDDGTGNTARMFNRRSTVSLLGRFGEIRLGHDLTPGYTSFGEFDTFGVSGLADQGKFHSTAFGSGIEGTGLWARADNMVTYFTPNTLGGFYAHIAVAAGEDTPAKAYKGGRIGYAAGKLDVTAAHSVFDGIAGNLTRSSLAANYDFSVVKVFGSAVRTNYLDAERLVTQVGVAIPVGQFGKVRANYTRVNASGTLSGASIEKDDATQIALGYIHQLSKNTTLYATYVSLMNEGKANFAVSTPPAAVAGNVSSGAEFGISYRF